MTDMTLGPTRYCHWDSYFTPEQCANILEYRTALDEQEGVVVSQNPEKDTIRNSRICWMPFGHWVHNTLHGLGIYANQIARWNFKCDDIEQVQLAKYDVDGFYKTHCDVALDHPSNMRKISMVALLSNPESFEGGAFEFAEFEMERPLKQGDVIVFPSFIAHHVTPVTSGERHSATVWLRGPR